MTSSWKDDDSQLELGEDESAAALRKAWDRALRSLSSRVSRSSFESFFQQTQPISLDDEVAVLGAPSAFAREWLEKRYGETLRNLLMQNLGRKQLQLKFVRIKPEARPLLGDRPVHDDFSSKVSSNGAMVPYVPPGDSDMAAEELTLAPPPVKKPAKKREGTAVRLALPAEMDLPLNDKFTFDNFIVGDSNRLAYSGALEVSQPAGRMYNPLFIYGDPGLGKTHLMHAIGHQIKASSPELRIAHVSGESFANAYIAAVRDRKSDDFRAVYRNVDVWLVDDIQTLAGKDHTKEEFFHTFNTLHQANKLIVLTSDQSPRELRAMDERLRSRFECGLIADVQPPQLEMRIAILHKKAQVEGMKIPDEVLFYMANLIQSNIRSLEGALIKIIAYASMSKSPVTEQLASDVLGSYFVERRPVMPHHALTEGQSRGNLSPLIALPLPQMIVNLSTPRSGQALFDHIVRTVSDYYNFEPHLLAGDGSVVASRRRDVAPARQIAIYLAREKTSIAVTELARLFGGISHSAVSHAHRKMVKQVAEDPKTAAVLNEIVSRL